MQYAFYLVPAGSSEMAAEELNRFLRGHRAVSVTNDSTGSGLGVWGGRRGGAMRVSAYGPPA